MTTDHRCPPGWYPLNVEAFTDGSQIILVGQPPEEHEDPDLTAHHCDAMGCRWSHVLARILMEPEHRIGLWHLIKAEIERAKAKDAPKPLSLREQVLARIGRRPPDRIR